MHYKLGFFVLFCVFYDEFTISRKSGLNIDIFREVCYNVVSLSFGCVSRTEDLSQSDHLRFKSFLLNLKLPIDVCPQDTNSCGACTPPRRKWKGGVSL